MKKMAILITILFCQQLVLAQVEKVFTISNGQVFKDMTTNTFQIIDSTGNEQYRDLKYVGLAERSLQVLDARNQMLYLDYNLNLITYPEDYDKLMCGTVDRYFLEIIENKNMFVIKKTENRVTGKTKKYIADRVVKKGIQKIYFLNTQKTLRYSQNSYASEMLIIEYHDKIGIRENKKTVFYDAIDPEIKLKVKKDGLWGYHNRTKNKYKNLERFVFNLSSFELPNGEKGYIDTNGVEYLN